MKSQRQGHIELRLSIYSLYNKQNEEKKRLNSLFSRIVMRKSGVYLKVFQINLIQRLFSQCSIQFKITKFSNKYSKTL